MRNLKKNNQIWGEGIEGGFWVCVSVRDKSEKAIKVERWECSAKKKKEVQTGECLREKGSLLETKAN